MPWYASESDYAEATEKLGAEAYRLPVALASLHPRADIPNVHTRPPAPRSAVTGLIGHAQVGLIPHVRPALTEAMSQLKPYEYLAWGLPAVAVDLPGIAGISDQVLLVTPGGEMEGAAHRALLLGREQEDRRLAFVAEHSWACGLDALLDIALVVE